uniref:S8 family peptidase n=1 Tax=Methanobrevibacter smithii TaxID=2173 RepID=UPI0037DD3B37
NQATNQLSDKIVFENFEVSPMSISSENTNQPTDKVEIKVLCDYENFNYDFAANANKSVAQQRSEIFAQGKAYHTQKNQQIINQINTDDMDGLYVSTYSPYFTYESTLEEVTANNYEQLNDLASYSYIEKIYVSPEHEYEPMLEEATEAIGVADYIDTGTLTGEDIVIGILDLGIVDEEHSNFNNIDLTVRKEWYYIETVTEHATTIASIMAKMCPDAKLLSVELSGNAVSEIDWMLDRNVNVINLSYGDENATGNYDSDSAYMDYIVNTYKVTIVAAVGNSGREAGYVANPALGYNVIGVGAYIAFNGMILESSSYKEANGPDKPNIVAPGLSIEIDPFGYYTGTSFSAPIVASCVALLMEERTDLTIHPEYVLALMMNNGDRDDEGDTIGLDEYAGGGRINFEEMMTYINNIIPITNNSESVYLTRTFNVVLLHNQTIRATAAWLSQANGNANGTSCTDYDLALIYKNNSTNEEYVMIHSVQTYDPNESFTFTLTSEYPEGVYTLRFKQSSDLVQEDHAALCYKIY